jgi:hypothetical protein
MEKQAELQVLELHKLYDEVEELQMKLPRSPSKTDKYSGIENEIMEKARALSYKARNYSSTYSDAGTGNNSIANFLKQAESILAGANAIQMNPYKRFYFL